MATTFNADEIFEMAGQIELNGVRFYRRAAELAKDAATRELLTGLAAMEEQHKRSFAQIQKGLAEAQRAGTVFDADDEVSLYVRAFADGVVFDPDRDPAGRIGMDDRLEEILATAIELEKDSIAFYTGLREMVPARLGREQVERIIREEMQHVRQLAQRRASLTA